MVIECRNMPCGIVETVGWCIMGFAIIKAQNDWRKVGQPSSCNASQIPVFLVVYIVGSILIAGKLFMPSHCCPSKGRHFDATPTIFCTHNFGLTENAGR